jgi:hypothetical protein
VDSNRWSLVALIAGVAFASPSLASTYRVGPDQILKRPSEAAGNITGQNPN